MIIALLAYFWLGSRYPSIDSKAALAGEVVLEDVLSFEAAFEIQPDDPTWKQVGLSTLNWISTNRQGMTFGVLLAALVLSLLQNWPIKRGGGTVSGLLKGVLIGAPLGVCVNCAAPIAYGMRREGVAHETSLAAMFASPTLNIVVLTMMFSLLPLYMAGTRLVVTLLFILIVLPALLARFAKPAEEDFDSGAESCALPIEENWMQACAGLARQLVTNLWFIARKTVPLMILAGFLGTLIAMLVPLESFAHWQIGLFSLFLVAALGTFAPVPIAFDIVLIQALLIAGLPAEFAMVLLVTLGTFSIYPLMLVGRMVNWRFSFAVFLSVCVLGVSSGIYAGWHEDRISTENDELFQQRMGSPQLSDQSGEISDPPSDPGADRTLPARSETKGQPSGVVSHPLQASSTASATLFEMTSGRNWNLVSHPALLLDLLLPFSQGRGLASGDYDADGWPDIALAQNEGVSLYRNRQGQSFEPVPLDMPGLKSLNTLVVSFVDINNDGCLDLFAGGLGESDGFVMNDCNGFSEPRWQTVPHQQGLITLTAGFADLDQDGDLDMLRGNWMYLLPRTYPSSRNANDLLMNNGDATFTASMPDEIHGATLAVLASDLNQDDVVDLMTGNDFQEPDIYRISNASGQLESWSGDHPVPLTTLATMSIDTADFDNDLDLDIYQSGKVNAFSEVEGRGRGRGDSAAKTVPEQRRFSLNRRQEFREEYCAQFSQPEDQANCQRGMAMQTVFMGQRLAPCLDLSDDAAVQDECIVSMRIKTAASKRNWPFCRDIPADRFPAHKQVCEGWAAFDKSSEYKKPGIYRYLDRGAIPQKDQGNVLLIQQDDGSFIERGEEMGVYDGHWAWSARFADLDQDEWQDLFVVNGWWLETSLYSNNFFHNQAGQHFEQKESEFGLFSRLKQHAFVYIDLDRDGDLDIITRSTTGDLQVYRNGEQSNNAIQFDFRDDHGNHFGIGNRLIIHYGENGENHQLREMKASGGFLSFDEPMLHFGLGPHESVERIEVFWSTGEKDELEGPFAAGHRHTITRK